MPVEEHLKHGLAFAALTEGGLIGADTFCRPDGNLEVMKKPEVFGFRLRK